MTQERRTKLVLLLTLAVYRCTRCNHSLYEMAFPNSWSLACVNACHLRRGSSASCVPGFLCCYRTDRVASDAVAFCSRTIGNIISIDCTTLFFFTVFFRKFFSTHSIQEVRMRQWRLGGWTSDATAKGSKQWPSGGEGSPLPINSEGETSFAEIASSMSAEPTPSEDTSTTSSGSESVIIADCDTELLGKW